MHRVKHTPQFAKGCCCWTTKLTGVSVGAASADSIVEGNLVEQFLESVLVLTKGQWYIRVLLPVFLAKRRGIGLGAPGNSGLQRGIKK